MVILFFDDTTDNEDDDSDNESVVSLKIVDYSKTTKLIPTPQKSFQKQVSLLFQREFYRKQRKISSLVIRMGIPMIQVLLYGINFLQCAQTLKTGRTFTKGTEIPEGQFNEKMNLVYGAMSNTHFIMWISAAGQTLLDIPNERNQFLREYTSSTYSVKAYLCAKFLIELPLQFFQSLLLMSISYWFYGMNGSFIPLWFVGFCLTIAGSSIGTLLSCLTTVPQTALVWAPLVLDAFPECFSGVLQPLDEIPAAFRWLSWFAPHSYAVEISGDMEFFWIKSGIPDFGNVSPSQWKAFQNSPLSEAQITGLLASYKHEYNKDPYSAAHSEFEFASFMNGRIPR